MTGLDVITDTILRASVTAAILAVTAFGAHAASLPSGDYSCTPSVVFQFEETGESFGVAAVLSTDTVFTRLASEADASLVYQAGGATYLIDKLEDDFSRFKYRVIYSGDLRSFTGFCKPYESP